MKEEKTCQTKSFVSFDIRHAISNINKAALKKIKYKIKKLKKKIFFKNEEKMEINSQIRHTVSAA